MSVKVFGPFLIRLFVFLLLRFLSILFFANIFFPVYEVIREVKAFSFSWHFLYRAEVFILVKSSLSILSLVCHGFSDVMNTRIRHCPTQGHLDIPLTYLLETLYFYIVHFALFIFELTFVKEVHGLCLESFHSANF